VNERVQETLGITGTWETVSVIEEPLTAVEIRNSFPVPENISGLDSERSRDWA
jgi:hypothetical protein